MSFVSQAEFCFSSNKQFIPLIFHILPEFFLYSCKFLDTISKLSFCAVFSFTYPFFTGIICLTSTEGLFPIWESLKYLFILWTHRSRFSFHFFMYRKEVIMCPSGKYCFLPLPAVASYGSSTGKSGQPANLPGLWFWPAPGYLLFRFCRNPAFFLRGLLPPVLSPSPVLLSYDWRGDIKLLSVLGGILGYPKVLSLLLLTFFTGAILSLAFLISCGNLKERILISSAIFIASGRTEAGNRTGEKDWDRKISISQFLFLLQSFY